MLESGDTESETAAVNSNAIVVRHKGTHCCLSCCRRRSAVTLKDVVTGDNPVAG